MDISLFATVSNYNNIDTYCHEHLHIYRQMPMYIFAYSSSSVFLYNLPLICSLAKDSAWIETHTYINLVTHAYTICGDLSYQSQPITHPLINRDEPHNLKIEKQDILNSTKNVNKWVTQ